MAPCALKSKKVEASGVSAIAMAAAFASPANSTPQSAIEGAAPIVAAPKSTPSKVAAVAPVASLDLSKPFRELDIMGQLCVAFNVKTQEEVKDAVLTALEKNPEGTRNFLLYLIEAPLVEDKTPVQLAIAEQYKVASAVVGEYLNLVQEVKTPEFAAELKFAPRTLKPLDAAMRDQIVDTLLQSPAFLMEGESALSSPLAAEGAHQGLDYFYDGKAAEQFAKAQIAAFEKQANSQGDLYSATSIAAKTAQAAKAGNKMISNLASSVAHLKKAAKVNRKPALIQEKLNKTLASVPLIGAWPEAERVAALQQFAASLVAGSTESAAYTNGLQLIEKARAFHQINVQDLIVQNNVVTSAASGLTNGLVDRINEFVANANDEGDNLTNYESLYALNLANEKAGATPVDTYRLKLESGDVHESYNLFHEARQLTDSELAAAMKQFAASNAGKETLRVVVNPVEAERSALLNAFNLTVVAANDEDAPEELAAVAHALKPLTSLKASHPDVVEMVSDMLVDPEFTASGTSNTELGFYVPTAEFDADLALEADQDARVEWVPITDEVASVAVPTAIAGLEAAAEKIPAIEEEGIRMDQMARGAPAIASE